MPNEKRRGGPAYPHRPPPLHRRGDTTGGGDAYDLDRPGPEPRDLLDLLGLMREQDPRVRDWSSLPTYGGEAPSGEELHAMGLDSAPVWSWDVDRVLAGASADALRLHLRPCPDCRVCHQRAEGMDLCP